MSTALEWFKSSYSGDEGGQCIEVAVSPRAIHIRDSKNPENDGPILRVSPTAWTAFLNATH